jgi:ABC-type uncharacterized transport system involved in gliding motility auxiliary subunit
VALMTTKTQTATIAVPLANPRGSAGVLYTVLYLLGMMVLFLAERMVLESKGLRLALDLGAAALFAAAIAGRLVRRARVGAAARAVETRILLAYVGGLVAVLLYLAQADFVMEKLRPRFAEAKGAERFQGVLAALWPTLWMCSILPLLFIEISYAAMDVSRTLEVARIRRSAQSGLVLAMTVCLVFALNYVFAEFNKKVDLSYFKTTQASESSRKMVKNLSEPFKVTLFFPTANEVEDQVRSYFEDLRRESKRLELRTVDHAMEPVLAKEIGVTDNGIVVLARGKQHEQINVGVKLQRAKSTLKKLDSEFQASFRKLSVAQKIAYLTVGHEERSGEERDKVRGSAIRDLRTLLQRLNYQVKELGVGQGLGQEVPGDATMVIVVGPRKDFLPAELAALKAYLRGGGRAFVFLDPEAGLDMAGLLGPFGLRFSTVRLANDRFHVRLTMTPADRHALFSNRFSAHPSMSTLSRNSSQVVTVMLGAGWLDEISPTETLQTKPQVQFTLHSMPFTWNDIDSNLNFDAPKEERKIYELAAVVTMPVTGKPPPPAPPGKKAEPPEMRLVVVADSDMMSDQVFRNPGNGYFFLDTVKWLGGEEEYIGETTSEEDVRILHSREKDQLWFYLTIFGLPAVVLGAGLYYTTRRRRRP